MRKRAQRLRRRLGGLVRGVANPTGKALVSRQSWLGRFAVVLTLGMMATGLSVVVSQPAAQANHNSLHKVRCVGTGYGTFCLRIERTGRRLGHFRTSLGPGGAGTYLMQISGNSSRMTTYNGWIGSRSRTWYSPLLRDRFLHPYPQYYYGYLYKKTRVNGSPRPDYYWRFIARSPGITFPDNW